MSCLFYIRTTLLITVHNFAVVIISLHIKYAILLHTAWINSKKLGFTLFSSFRQRMNSSSGPLSTLYYSDIQYCRVANTKKAELVPKKPDSSLRTYTHKTSMTKHKIDIKTRQKHRYTTILIFRSIFFPRNYTVAYLFLINNINHF